MADIEKEKTLNDKIAAQVVAGAVKKVTRDTAGQGLTPREIEGRILAELAAAAAGITSSGWSGDHPEELDTNEMSRDSRAKKP